MSCVLIMSAPRSGSSCLAGCLHLCGIPMGNLTTIKHEWNAKGYFENEKIMWWNDNLLQEIGYPDRDGKCPFWLSPNPLNKDQIKTSLGRSDELKELLNEQFGHNETFAIKLPTTLLLNELYFHVIKDVKVIALHRNRIQSSGSLSRFGSGLVKKCDTKANHRKFETLLDDVCKIKPHIHVRFENLITSPLKTMKEITNFIGVPEPDPQKLLEFVDEKLVHSEENKRHCK